MIWPETFEGGNLGDGRPATATDRPENIEALCQLVTDRVTQGLAIYPQGGGTSLDYGEIPRQPGVALDTRSISRVIDYPAADMTVTVEAGITLAALREVLATENQRLLIEAPEPEKTTLGAIFATNTSGPRRFGAGRPRDQILGVGFATSDGALVRGGGRVVKNVAGYDFPRLLTGSMGTLGIIVEVTLKVRPRPEASAIVCAGFKNAERLGLALDDLNTSATRPIAIEVLNPSASEFPGVNLGLPPEHWILLVGFEDNAASVTWQVEQLRSELKAFDLTVHKGSEAEPIWSALTGFQALAIGEVMFMANLRPSTVARFAGMLSPVRWAVQSHAGNGIVRAHLIESMELEPLATEIDRYRLFALKDGGNLVVSRCPTAWKARLKVWGDPRPDWTVSEKIKKAFDPIAMMNPGRFVGKI